MSSPALFAAPLEVDRTSLLELARGGNLYTDRFAFLRELLQNAVDATLLRLFVERGIDAFPTHEDSLHDLRRALADFPIDVTIGRLEDVHDGPEPMRRYRVRVEDRGLGIARADIPHLQRIASSSKNPHRAALIASMPEWMRPSGAFGIGLQSAFLVADELSLSTRTLAGEAHTVVLRANDGGSLEVHESEHATVGTAAELVVRVPLRWRSLHGPIVTSDWTLHDVVRDGWIDPQIESARGLARQFAAGGHVPVRVEGASVPFLFEGERARFDPDTGIEIVLPIDDGEAASITAQSGGSEAIELQLRQMGNPTPTTYYRGAPALLGIRDSMLLVRTNVHIGTARDLLELGRDRFVAARGAALSERIHATIRRFGPAHSKELRARGASNALRCRTSLLLHACGATDFGDEWRSLAVATHDDAPVDLGTLVDEGRLEVSLEPLEVTLKRRSEGQHLFHLSSGATLRSISHTRDERIRQFLPGIVQDAGGRATWCTTPGFHFTSAHLIEELSKLRDVVRPPLGLSDDLLTLAVRPPDKDHHYAACWGVSPWTFVDGVVEVPEPLRWIEFVVANATTPATPDLVARALVRLLRLGDPVLRGRAELSVRYDLAAVVAEIVSRYETTID